MSKELKTEKTLYDVQKEMYKQVPPLDAIMVTKNIEEISQKMNDSYKYGLLLCRELNDYTIFDLTNKDNNEAQEKIKNELLLSFQSRGEIMDMMDGSDEDSWHIWVKQNDEYYMYLLFKCDDWVINI